MEELEEKLKRIEKERDEYLAGWQRAKADFLNYKKEEGERIASLLEDGKKVLAKDLIVVLDDFDLAVLNMDIDKARQSLEGLFLIRDRFAKVLSQHGLEKITHSLGQTFTPETAEVLTEILSKYPVGTIAQEVRCGWKLNGKVIRPATVILSKGEETV